MLVLLNPKCDFQVPISQADWVLMTVNARTRVEDRSKPMLDIVSQLINLLVKREAVAGRFGDPVADAARARLINEGRCIEACWRLCRVLLRRHWRRDARTAQQQNDRPMSSGDHHGISSSTKSTDQNRR